MRSVSCEEMRELERKAVIKGISTLTLMENAGRGTAELILARFSDSNKILIICGKGNNGGDGFVIARYLQQAAKDVSVLLLGEASELKGDALQNYQRVLDLPNINVIQAANDPDHFPPAQFFKSFDLIVDAIFGTGLKSHVTGIQNKTIEAMNASRVPLVAADIPSGLDGDLGEIHGICVQAQLTATMGIAKHGLLRGQGPKVCGEIVIIDIGI